LFSKLFIVIEVFVLQGNYTYTHTYTYTVLQFISNYLEIKFISYRFYFYQSRIFTLNIFSIT